MMLIMYVERVCARPGGKNKETESIGWMPDGKSFVIWNTEHFTSTWLVLFFGQLKLSSFVRKLYRWRFRQIKLRLSVMMKDGLSQRVMCFGHENFQRDDWRLLSEMHSITAEKCRRQKTIELPETRREINSADTTGKAVSLDYKQMKDNVTSTTTGNQPATIRHYESSNEPDFDTRSLMPTQASIVSISGQSVPKQTAAGGIEGNANIVTSWTLPCLSAQPVPSQLLRHALHYQQLVRSQSAVRVNHPERNAPTYEDHQLVAQVILLYQLQHHFAAG